MAALAVPMAVTPGYLPVQPRDAPPKIPFLVEDASCRQSYDFTSDTKYAKMLTAVKHARDMAQLAIQEWWEEGKHGEAAATYLAIPDDGNYKENEFAQMVHANLQNVAALDEAVPLIGHKVQVFCTDKYNKCDKRIEGSNK
jgi:hypothetical protein